MIIDIHDVGHGACTTVTSSVNQLMMIDCGYGLDSEFFPSVRYRNRTLEMLILQNLDNDHVDDLPYLLKGVGIKALRSNPTVSAERFFAMKQDGGMNDALWEVYRLLKDHGPYPGVAPAFSDFWWHCFWNAYGSPFIETNNLSLPVFVGNNNFSMLFGGDLEGPGWRLLLRNPVFCQRLRAINILVASHHGRDNGCCEEIFDYCYPDIVIISDYEHRHETQQTTGWYGNRVRGILDKTDPMYLLGRNPTRRVLTTRSDGSMKIDVHPDGGYTIYKNTKPMGLGASLSRSGYNGLLGPIAS